MSVYVQFNCLVHNETAKKAMENYVGILQEAFEHYRNLWDDYIKLQKKYECNEHPSSQVIVDKACNEKENELTPQKQSNGCVIKQESDSVPLLELDTVNIHSINFNSDTESGSLYSRGSLHKNINNPPKSPVFCRTSAKTNSASARKAMHSNKAASVYDNLTDMKTHHSIEKVSSKCQKLGISTSQHVETTFLPNGKRLKQSRLIFQPVKCNEKTVMMSDTDKHKTVSISPNVKQDVKEDISVAKASVTPESDAAGINESFEDVIEISPTQRNVKLKVRHRLKLKRNISATKTIGSPSKNKCHGFSPAAVPEITINDIDFALCPSPEHNSMQMEDDKSLVKDSNNVINALKDKVNNISNFSPVRMYSKINVPTIKLTKVQKEDQPIIKEENISQNMNDLTYEDETFYLPAEQIANGNNTNDFNLNDTENRPPAKKMLLDNLDILPKRKNVSEQLNTRCKADRAKLDGWDCWECKEYYKNLSLSKEELQKRRNQCSRHRHKYERPNTPEGFWDPEFPETLSSTYRQVKN